MPDFRKITQLAAYILHKAGDGPMDAEKLMRLMYLADRESLDAYGFPITGDTYSSTRKGPVLDMTLDLFYGNGPKVAQEYWNEWVSTLSSESSQLLPNSATYGAAADGGIGDAATS